MQRLAAKLAAGVAPVPSSRAAIVEQMHQLGGTLLWDICSCPTLPKRQLSTQATALTSLRNFSVLQPACTHRAQSRDGLAATPACRSGIPAASNQQPQPGRRGISCSAAAPLDVTAVRQSGYDASQIQVALLPAAQSHGVILCIGCVHVLT